MINSARIRILFCPQFEPFQPYLSLPYIKSLLKKYDIESTYYDANVDFYDWLFNQIENSSNWTDEKEIFLRNNLKSAIKILKLGTANISEYRFAINLIEESLLLISPEYVRLSLSGMEIKNIFSSNDLKSVVFSENNIFKDFFNKEHSQILGNHDVNYYFFSLVVLDQLGASLCIAREIKRLKPDAKIVFGGAMISRFYKKLVKINWLKQIVDFLEPGEAYKIIPKLFNIGRIYEGHVSPDYSELQLEKYLSMQTVLPYLVAHGCKWGKCTFCSHHLSYESYRTSSLEDVLVDLIELKRKYNTQYVSFCDEYLTPIQAETIAIKLKELDIDIKWSTFARAEKQFTDSKFTSTLYNGGCRLLFFGLETISQRLLKLMKKGNNVKYYKPILQACKDTNVAVRLDIMFGFPTETPNEAQQTIDFIINNRAIIDTPFSCLPISVFELREDIPVFNDLQNYGLGLKALSRGDLDEQYDFVILNGTENSRKIEFKNKCINYVKQNMNMETMCPYNKTHQLIYKSLYDSGQIKDINLDLKSDCDTRISFVKGIQVIDNLGFVYLNNFATGSQLKISQEFISVVKSLNRTRTISYLFEKSNPSLSHSQISNFVSFLRRYDFVQFKR